MWLKQTMWGEKNFAQQVKCDKDRYQRHKNSIPEGCEELIRINKNVDFDKVNIKPGYVYYKNLILLQDLKQC